MLLGTSVGISSVLAGCSIFSSQSPTNNEINQTFTLLKNYVPTEVQFNGEHQISYLSSQAAQVATRIIDQNLEEVSPSNSEFILLDTFIDVSQEQLFEQNSPERQLYTNLLQKGDSFVIGERDPIKYSCPNTIFQKQTISK